MLPIVYEFLEGPLGLFGRGSEALGLWAALLRA